MDNKGEIEWLQEQLKYYKCRLDVANSFGSECEIAAIRAKIAINSLVKSIEALEKQVPIKPREIRITDKIKDGYCNCGNEVCNGNKYCCECGQMLDWS